MGVHVLDRQAKHTIPTQRQAQPATKELGALIPDEMTYEQQTVVSERASLWRLRLAAGVLAAGAVTTSAYLVEYANNPPAVPVMRPTAGE